MVTARKHIMFIAILAVWWEGQGQLAPLFDMIIAQDESGDLITTTQGISSAPRFGSSRFRIKLCAGIYNENIVINKEKTNLTIIGEGMERGIITGSRSYGDGMKTFETATVVALLTKASYPAFYKCRIIGFHDTLYAEKGNIPVLKGSNNKILSQQITFLTKLVLYNNWSAWHSTVQIYRNQQSQKSSLHQPLVQQIPVTSQLCRVYDIYLQAMSEMPEIPSNGRCYGL
ncbi:hypothetical protein GOBAR_DD13602 [Gossypium barbadense]|nr:hypothetical protein GOBAR_DD13602 [Gossypium barbadense]